MLLGQIRITSVVTAMLLMLKRDIEQYQNTQIWSEAIKPDLAELEIFEARSF